MREKIILTAIKKWRNKRNWQKLLSLGMITENEANIIRDEVEKNKARKKQYFLDGRPGHERADPVG